jgi:hypothetical protein
MKSEQKDRLFSFLILQLDSSGNNTERAWEMITGNNYGSFEETIAALKFITISSSAKNSTKSYARALLAEYQNGGTNIDAPKFNISILK